MGYSTIILKAKERLAPTIRDSIVNFTQMTIGPEIMEEDIRSITIKDMLDPTEMPFDKTIRRMYILTRTMHEDAISSMENGDVELAEEVITRDNDVDRLHLLIARQSNMILRDMTLSKKMGVSMEDAIHYFMISRILERVGDHAARIETNAIPLIQDSKALDRKVLGKISSASKRAIEILTHSVDALLKRDIALAHRTIDSVEKLYKLCEAIEDIRPRKEGHSSIHLNYIAESIRRTGEYSGDISELVINNLIKYK
jgi:phosphate uptake regulator